MNNSECLLQHISLSLLATTSQLNPILSDNISSIRSFKRAPSHLCTLRTFTPGSVLRSNQRLYNYCSYNVYPISCKIGGKNRKLFTKWISHTQTKTLKYFAHVRWPDLLVPAHYSNSIIKNLTTPQPLYFNKYFTYMWSHDPMGWTGISGQPSIHMGWPPHIGRIANL